jgi:hypothetical protein
VPLQDDPPVGHLLPLGPGRGRRRRHGTLPGFALAMDGLWTVVWDLRFAKEQTKVCFGMSFGTV